MKIIIELDSEIEMDKYNELLIKIIEASKPYLFNIKTK